MRRWFLPLVMLFAGAALSSRLGDAWHLLAPADAVAATAAPARPPESKPEPKTEAKPDEAEPPRVVGDDVPAGQGTVPALGELVPLTQAEIDLLQKLAERREVLERREREIELREGLVRAAEAKLDTRSGELKTLQASLLAEQKRLEELVKTQNEQELARIASLVKIYENMRPKDAARIFDQLDQAVLYDVLKGMKEAKTAPILASMDPDKARTMTALLREKKGG